MDLTDVALPIAWSAFGWVAAIAALALAVRAAPGRRPATGEAVHLFMGGVLVLSMLWCLRGEIGDTFAFHLLGTAALTLTLGTPLALLAGAAVVVAVTFAREASWANAGIVWLTAVALPVAVVRTVLAVAERHLAPHFFIYVFVGCFGGAALAFVVSALAASALMVLAGGLPGEIVFGQYLPYLLQLAFGEATLTGMCLTLAIVYRPRWVATFSDARYIEGR